MQDAEINIKSFGLKLITKRAISDSVVFETDQLIRKMHKEDNDK